VPTDPEKLEAVKNWPQPTDKNQLRSFLGLCTYYRRLVSGFADIATPLTRLAEDNGYSSGPRKQNAFGALKEALCTAPVLGYPRPGETFIVDTDASYVGIGGVLSQVQDCDKGVMAHFSKTLPKAERNYCDSSRVVGDCEGPRTFSQILYRQEFHLRTDHSALTWLLSFRNLEGQATRWVQRLQKYFTSNHHQGIRHTNADTISRRPYPEECFHCQKIE
jgi:hypothetical protein